MQDTTQAVLLVGTTELQLEGVTEAFGTFAPDAAANMHARELGLWLSSHDLDELEEEVPFRSLRNGPVLEHLVRGGRVRLLLVATDQPPPPATPEKHWRGDTVEVARVLAELIPRWLPGVRCTLTDPVTCNPAVVSQRMLDQLRDLLAPHVGGVDAPVCLLGVGSTPALRLAAAAVLPGIARGPVTVLRPDPNDGSVVVSDSAQLLDRIALRRHLAAQAKAAVAAGNAAALDAIAQALRAAAEPDTARSIEHAAVLVRRVSDGQMPWAPIEAPGAVRELVDEHSGDVAAAAPLLGKIAALRRLETGGRLGAVLVRYVTVTEQLPAVWAQLQGSRGGEASVLTALFAPTREICNPGYRPPDHDTLHAAALDMVRCLAGVGPVPHDACAAPRSALTTEQRAQGRWLGRLRFGGGDDSIRHLRNQWVHEGRLPTAAVVRHAVAEERRDLDLGADDTAGIADTLMEAATAVLECGPIDPLQAVDELVERAFGVGHG